MIDASEISQNLALTLTVLERSALKKGMLSHSTEIAKWQQQIKGVCRQAASVNEHRDKPHQCSQKNNRTKS